MKNIEDFNRILETGYCYLRIKPSSTRVLCLNRFGFFEKDWGSTGIEKDIFIYTSDNLSRVIDLVNILFCDSMIIKDLQDSDWEVCPCIKTCNLINGTINIQLGCG